MVAIIVSTTPLKAVKIFANEPILVIGMMQTPVTSNGWRIEDAEFIKVRDGFTHWSLSI